MQVGCNILHGVLLMGSWFPRLRVTPHHFDFDVGSTVGMVALGVWKCCDVRILLHAFYHTQLIVWL